MSELSGNPEQVPYTPTTEEVSKSYVWFRDQAFTDEKLKAEFDRWLVEVKTDAYDKAIKALFIGPAELLEVKAQAWAEGYEAGLTDFASSMTTNPYRQGEEHV